MKSMEFNIEKETVQLEEYVKHTELVHKRRMGSIQIAKVVGVIALLIITAFSKVVYGQELKNRGIQEGIADQILRFHVLANSDSTEDQALKLKVKQEVVTYLQEVLVECNSKEEAKIVLASYYDSIQEVAKRVIEQEGYSYDVRVEISNQYFPVKIYGDLVFPEGEYEALRVLIGEAEGKNWWCVIFPSLCMVNETYTVVPDDSKDTLREVLTEEEYDSISEEADPVEQVECRFWIVDFITGLFS